MAKQKSLQYGLAKKETTTKVERQLKIVERYFKSFRREGQFAGRSALLEYAEMMLLNTWIFAKNSKHVPTNTFRKRMSCANEAPVHCLQRGLDCHMHPGQHASRPNVGAMSVPAFFVSASSSFKCFEYANVFNDLRVCVQIQCGDLLQLV